MSRRYNFSLPWSLRYGGNGTALLLLCRFFEGEWSGEENIGTHESITEGMVKITCWRRL
jgi:hypothetical protein